MEVLIYIARCVIVLIFTWFCVRIIGKKSISQLTAYEFTALMIMANVAAEPLVFKISSKAFLGSLTISIFTIFIGWLSLYKKFYNFDTNPEILIINGKIDQKALKRNKINLPFLLSMLRLKGYTKVSDAEFAILEPNGNLSVIPASQNRHVTPKDLKLQTQYEGISLPLIIDGEIQYNNLKFAKLDITWLNQELKKFGVVLAENVFLAELDSTGKLYVDVVNKSVENKPELI